MESINQLTTNVQNGLNRSCERPDSEASNKDIRLSEETVAQIFLRFQAIFGTRWTANIPDEDTESLMLAEWSNQLGGLDDQQIQRGFDRLAERKGRDAYWPPSALEFRELCLPTCAELGIPETEEAYRRAIHRDYGYPEVYFTAQRVWHHLTQSRAELARRHFAQEYGQIIRDRRRGKTFEWPDAMQTDNTLEDKPTEPRRADKQTALSYYEQMKKQLRGAV